MNKYYITGIVLCILGAFWLSIDIVRIAQLNSLNSLVNELKVK